jgi:hypothetical protein
MNTRGGVDVRIAPQFFNSVLDGDEWSASLPSRFNPTGRALDIHWVGGWVGSRAGLDAVE